MGDVNAGLEAAGALSIKGPYGCAGWEAGDECSGTVFGCSTAWGQDAACGDVFNKLGVYFGSVE
jgi:hypothetical protein